MGICQCVSKYHLCLFSLCLHVSTITCERDPREQHRHRHSGRRNDAVTAAVVPPRAAAVVVVAAVGAPSPQYLLILLSFAPGPWPLAGHADVSHALYLQVNMRNVIML